MTKEQAERYCSKIVRRNQRIRNDDPDRAPMLWTADDPKGSFEYRGQKVTVNDYFSMRYHLNLKYPKMPVVLTKKYGYYPIEFMFQAKGIVKVQNSDVQSQSKLAYHDQFSGVKKIDHLQKAIANLQIDIEAKVDLEIAKESVSLNAIRLAEPELTFGNGETQDVDNGFFKMIGYRGALSFNKYVLQCMIGMFCL